MPPLTAVSDVVVGLIIAIPVLLVGGGVAVATRRGRDQATSVAEDGTGLDAAPAPAPRSDTAVLDDVAAPESVAPPPADSVAVQEPATYRGRLGKARGLLATYVSAVRAKGRIDAGTWDDLEEALIRADVGVAATDALLGDLRARVSSGDIGGPDALVDALRVDLVSMLSGPVAPLGTGSTTPSESPSADSGPSTESSGDSAKSVDVWLFVGVNGVGKTTTVGKVATRLVQDQTPVLLAAGDTFRAAAGEQLSLWAERSGADIVRGAEGGDPSAVVFDAVQRAASKGIGVVLADTAGRLHNKVNLIEELKKIRRVADRSPGRVVEVLLVLDATTGQNGLAQAKVFLEAVDVTGVVLTKLDGTAKGGIVVAIQRELGLPVRLVGLGEGPADLIDFDPTAFVDALF